jgi:hypothetical protein
MQMLPAESANLLRLARVHGRVLLDYGAMIAFSLMLGVSSSLRMLYSGSEG